MTNFAFGLGVGTKSSSGTLLEVYYHAPLLNADQSLIDAVAAVVGYEGGNECIELENSQLKALEEAFLSVDAEAQAEVVEILSGTSQTVLVTILESDAEPTSTAEAYLKLTLLSQRLVKPHGINLSGIFGLLPNVAWTDEGAIALEDLPKRQLAARAQGRILGVNSVDKFPKMSDYVVPTGIRIGDASRIRLGAHVGEGTTVMHEGFINFNAGTMGVSMVEGRISAGVIVGDGSDLGGGCSTMGTLSGGNKQIISVGENCLIGANAGLGLPLGDRCTLEAGLYVTAGSKVTLLDDQGKTVGTIKAADLAGKPDLLFRRNSQTGRIEVKTNKTAIELNSELHKHN
ncbi:2,3,4,5-tetrahydropyridine-2,6-dicarboxylate N-succinyltransferase [Neptuniibacter sp. CAU 1671]|uniref:2,3,4,5-tetrahydropyridine-2,6-dicarboxylate N-succinyltransferase n=1 Tax=Neptuniibacter sp. CAU 1671 TaxID=3032593 RepID=UPI0023D9884B|nr:2,3,4,5-tetrahydropyridine-2,6-dicarboxylate N-succinyltransferase [Neptuniibacter sp. CAU 1671]MDF2181849.1 2,3,4,5-tetrahydropyridine-2,6-dicarboxylate N-succinyltransferase [Neptuniibacter sp. CAU 1671]